MIRPPERHALRDLLQTLFLGALSLTAVGPVLWKRGPDVVTRTYLAAAQKFWAGESPYVTPAEGTDWFKYSPAFSFLYRPFLALSPSMHVLLWAALNALVFWWGVGAWFRLERRQSKLIWIAFVAAAMELDISLRYQQVNALLAGLTLYGLALYARARPGRAAFSAGLAAQLKVLPGVFAGALLYPWRPRYALSLLGTLLALFLLPALAVGWVANLARHVEWLALLARNLGEPGLLDLKSVFARMDAFFAGEFLRSLVLLASIVVFAGYRLFEGKRENFDYGAWYSFGMAALLLLSPRSESPTFVWIAPAYLFFAAELAPPPRRAWFVAAWALILFFVTFCYTDLWPKVIWNPLVSFYASKTLGTFALWGISATLLVRSTLKSSFRRKPDAVS